MVRLIHLLNSLLFNVGARVAVVDDHRARRMEGAFLLATNHLGFLDALLVYHLAWRDDVILLVGEKWQRNPFTRWLVERIGGIFVDRANADVRAMREVHARLKQGGVLVVSPEGTRSPTGGLIQPRHGTAYLAAKMHLPIIPLAVTGTADAEVRRSWRRLRRAPITVTFGEPFELGPLDRGDRDEVLAGYSDEVMCRIGALLPPRYRGVYADHPRLQELIDP